MRVRLSSAVLLLMLVFVLGCSSDSEQSKADDDKTSSRMEESTMNGDRALANVAPPERSNYFSQAPEMTIDQSKTYIATVHTAKGDIVLELDSFYAPQHTNNFVFLARQGFYDGLTFHRYEPGFVIQGGDPLGDGTGGPGYRVPAEIGLPHIQGAVAMARQGDAVNPERMSSGSQFYITLKPTAFLDGGYSVFGKVTAGFEVVRQIRAGDVITSVDIEER